MSAHDFSNTAQSNQVGSPYCNYLVTCGSEYRATYCHTAFLRMLADPPARVEP
jgi:hypothetical protein